MQLSSECKTEESEIHTFKPIGITPSVNSFTNILVNSLTIDGSTTLTSGWHTLNDGVAYLSWLRTLRVGLGER
jgi:hypothetical protein